MNASSLSLLFQQQEIRKKEKKVRRKMSAILQVSSHHHNHHHRHHHNFSFSSQIIININYSLFISYNIIGQLIFFLVLGLYLPSDLSFLRLRLENRVTKLKQGREMTTDFSD